MIDWLFAGCVASDHDQGPPQVPSPPRSTPTTESTSPTTAGLLAFADGRLPRNVLTVSLDTTRRDRIGRYGGGDTTPFLDGLLAQAVVFDDHRSCSNWTGPSMYCATMGALPQAHGVWPASQSLVVDPVPEDIESLEQALFLAHVDVQYRAELRGWDAVFAEMWAALDALGVLDDTLVVFYTDHGEQLLERGVLDHGFHLYAEESVAAAALWARGLVAAVWSGPTSHEDIAVTLHQLYGMTPGHPRTGVALGGAPADRVLRLMNYAALDAGVTLGVVRADLQLTYHWGGSYRTLHRNDSDPAQQVDVYDPTDPDVIALWDHLQPFVDEVGASFTNLPPPVSPGP